MDPLRAARVALIGERFRYFCSAECREAYRPEATATPLPQPRPRRIPGALRPEDVVSIRCEGSELSTRRQTAEALDDVSSDPLDMLSRQSVVSAARAGADSDLAENERGAVDGAGTAVDWIGGAEVGTLLLALASMGGTLAVVLALAGATPPPAERPGTGSGRGFCCSGGGVLDPSP
ncbi:hypothetical protein ACFL5O_06415 [Myxococcota bacterium]